MGLKKRVELGSGIDLPEAYYRISTVGGDKGNLILTLCLYASQDAFENGRDCLEQKYYEFVPSVEDGAPNYHKQGYEHLKNLTDFQDAIDV